MVITDVLRLLRERAGSAWEGKPLRLLRLQDSQIYKVRGCCGRGARPARNMTREGSRPHMLTCTHGCPAG